MARSVDVADGDHDVTVEPLARVLDALPHAVIAVDGDAHLTYWNAAGGRLCGLVRGVDGDLTVHEAIGGPAPGCLDEAVRRALDGDTWCGELVCLTDAGERRVPSVALPLRDDKQQVDGAVVVAGAELPPTTGGRGELLETALRLESDAVLIVTPDGVVTDATAGVLTVFGVAAESLVGTDVTRLVAPDRRAENRQVRMQLLAGEPVGPYETQAVRADGSRVDVGVSPTVVRRADGTPSALVVVVRDVTPLHELSVALSAVERRYAAVVDATTEGVLVIAPDRRVEHTGAQLATMLGRPLSQLLGLDALELVVPADRDDVARALATAWDDRPVRVECRLQRADGSVLAAQLTLVGLDDETGRHDAVVITVSDVGGHRRRDERLARLALHDPLTDLPNRTLFADRLEHALQRLQRQRGSVAVLICDVDRFSVVNDAMGHIAGDQLLAALAQRIVGAVRPQDTVGRLGGDELGVLCEDLRGPHEALGAADRVRRAVTPPFTVEGREVFLTVSIGVAHVATATDVADVLSAADAALCRAKQRGGGRSELFDESMRRAARRALDRTTALQHAIDRGELVVYYQPEVDLATGEPVAVEALLRWEHPDGGRSAAEEFIAVAEDIGLLGEIAEHMLVGACQTATRHPEWGEQVRVCVDLSPRQLVDPRLADTVRTALDSSQLRPSRLVVEATEAAILRAPDVVLRTLAELRAIGVRLCMDGFGGANSSPLHLKLVAPHEVKLSTELVAAVDRDSTDLAIAAGAISLAQAIGATPVAMGVETEAQRDALLRVGCRMGQGLLWSLPVAEDDVADVLADLVARSQPTHPHTAVAAPDPVALTRMTTLFREGASMHSIAAALNAEGLRTPGGVRWHARTVARALRASMR